MRFVLTAAVLSALTVGLIGGLTAAPVPKEKEKAKVKDEDAIQGTWQIEKFDLGGGPGGPPAEEVAKMKLVFKESKVAAVRGSDAKPDEIDYKIDASTTPKALDLIENGRPMLAIYELDGDTLKICMSEGGQKGVRPSEFKTDGKNTAVITLKRVKDEKKDK
jgi:uncharacterized protein (TIGR03067 family)